MPTTADEPLDMDQVRIDTALGTKDPLTLALRRQVLPFAAVLGSGVRGLPGPTGSLGLEVVERSVRSRSARRPPIQLRYNGP